MEDNTIDLRWRRHARHKPERCPHCGSQNIVPVAYGLPDEDMHDAAMRGDITLGGCVVIIDHSPAWRCKDCKKSCGVVTD